MARRRTGADIGFPAKLHPDEDAELRHIAESFGISRNLALRWAIRYAADHRHTEECQGPSSCQAAMVLVCTSTPQDSDHPSEATGR